MRQLIEWIRLSDKQAGTLGAQEHTVTFAHAERLVALMGSEWRLPTVAELLSFEPDSLSDDEAAEAWSWSNERTPLGNVLCVNTRNLADDAAPPDCLATVYAVRELSR